METMLVQGVELILSTPTRTPMQWVGHREVQRQLQAAWLILSNQDLPMTPRIIGKPGIGKTTLAYCVAREYTEQVYIFQCTVDTRPEDLLVTPVIGENQHIRYHASPLVTAMLTGGICILDEGNRMGEKSWASLAPLLDNRRYVESIVAGIKIPAHPDFRLAVTMNQDASTFDVPDYIQSRLQPQIEVGFPSQEEELEILRVNLPEAPEDLLERVSEFLQRSHTANRAYTTRDGVNIARYAVKLIHLQQTPQSEAMLQAMRQVLGTEAVEFQQLQQQADHDMMDYARQIMDVLLLGSPAEAADGELNLQDLLLDADESDLDFDDELLEEDPDSL